MAFLLDASMPPNDKNTSNGPEAEKILALLRDEGDFYKYILSVIETDVSGVRRPRPSRLYYR